MNLHHLCNYAFEVDPAPNDGLKEEAVGRLRPVGFTTAEGTDEIMIFNASSTIGSCGLNLHQACNYAFEVDPAPNNGLKQQAVGRLRRVGQQKIVQHFEMYVANTFYDRAIAHRISKTLPMVISDLSLNITWLRTKFLESKLLIRRTKY